MKGFPTSLYTIYFYIDFLRLLSLIYLQSSNHTVETPVNVWRIYVESFKLDRKILSHTFTKKGDFCIDIWWDSPLESVS